MILLFIFFGNKKPETAKVAKKRNSLSVLCKTSMFYVVYKIKPQINSISLCLL